MTLLAFCLLAFCLPKRFCTSEDVRGLPPNNPQQSSPRVKYTIEPLLRPMEPSNSLPLIEARLLSLEPSNKVHTLFDTWVPFDYTSEGPNFFVQHLRILLTWLWYHVRITNLHNSMILSTLSISSHDFALNFHKMSRTVEMYSFTYKPMIIP